MVRVFVNHCDRYTGKFISKVLGGTKVGSTVQDAGDTGAGENEDQRQPSGASKPDSSDTTYEILGTLHDADTKAPDWLTQVVKGDDLDELLSALLTCDIIVYHTTEASNQVDQASWAVQSLHDQLSVFTSQKVFICISSVLTWARSKPLDPEEPDVPFTEEDYRRRRPHPNFKNQAALEKLVIKLGKTDKSKFLGYVVCAGLTYGQGESIFHFLFKSAWHGQLQALPIFGNGQNNIPTIHIRDLASIVLNLADSRPKTRYVLAVDDSSNSLREIVKTISKGLGTGKTQHISKEDGLLSRDITQGEYDQLLVNLRMEATCVKDNMTIDWVAESGIVESMSTIIKEYKETRGLLPIRVCVLGPPAVGKTHLVSQLCRHYKLHHIKIADVIKEAIEKLERTASRSDGGGAVADAEAEDDQEEEEEDDGAAEQAQEMLDLLKEDKEENKGLYSEQYILDFYKQKLASMPAQNQGFVLDGFPKTYNQGTPLFAAEEGEEEDEISGGGDDDSTLPYNKLTMPEVVICLEAKDEFLKQRVMNLPQSVVEGTHNTEEGLLRRLALYRSQNEEDNTVLNYFDELEIHPVHIDCEQKSADQILDQMKKLIGEPRNYGPSSEEKAEVQRKNLEEQLTLDTEKREATQKMEERERELRAQREAEWNAQLAHVQREEQEMLETQSIPLRNYLMRHVMPTLTQGLIEVCKVKPEDATDYLAEYLFKNNPQID